MQNRFLFVIAFLIGLSANQARSVTFFSEDFESYTMHPDVEAIGNWTISHTAAAMEIEDMWVLADTRSVADAFGLPNTTHFGPGTASGSSTPPYDPTGTVPGGKYMLSRADGIVPNTLATFPSGTLPPDPQLADGGDPWENRINNGTYTGASSDMTTPSFSTAGAAGDVWLHANISGNLNDGGQAIFDIDISTDGGANWVNKFRRIAPGAGRNFASGDFNSDLDVDGFDFLQLQRAANFADCLTCNGSDPQNAHDVEQYRRDSEQRLSDWSKAFNGAYTPLVATVAAKDSGGVNGEFDLNLGNLGGATDVKVRFRHFESRDDEFLAFDNVVVDEAPPAGSASQVIFSEDFNDMLTLGAGGQGLGKMGAYEFDDATSFLFGYDSGHGGSRSGKSWGAQDRPTLNDAGAVTNANGRYLLNTVQQKGVNHLGHPVVEGPNGEVPFAIIDPESEPGPQISGSFQSERLHTTMLDLSNYDTVILEWDDEVVWDGDPFAGSIASVVIMVDNGDGIPNNFDTVLNEPDKFTDIYEPYTPYDQFGGTLFAGGDDPIFGHHRIDISADAAGLSNVYIAWQFRSSRTDYWAVDNVLITGELAPAIAATIPEPTSLLLTVLGLPLLGMRRRRLHG